MNKAIFGIVRNQTQAQQIVEQLLSAGFENKDISVLFSQGTPGQQSPAQSQTRTGSNPASSNQFGTQSKTTSKSANANQGRTGTSSTPTTSLGTLRLATINIPGLGQFMAAGSIANSLNASSTKGGTTTLTNTLVTMGLPEYEAVHLIERLKEKNTILFILTAENSQNLDEAREVLESNDVEDLAFSSETAVPGKRSQW